MERIKKTKASSKASPSQRRLKFERTIFQISLLRWDVSWIFSLADNRGSSFNHGNHYESLALKLYGKVIFPENFKYPDVECDLYADWKLNREEVPSCIGSMMANKHTLEIYIPIPPERLECLIATADRLLALEVNAEPLRYRRARVMSICLDSRFDSDF